MKVVITSYKDADNNIKYVAKLKGGLLLNRYLSLGGETFFNPHPKDFLEPLIESIQLYKLKNDIEHLDVEMRSLSDIKIKEI